MVIPIRAKEKACDDLLLNHKAGSLLFEAYIYVFPFPIISSQKSMRQQFSSIFALLKQILNIIKNKETCLLLP